MAEFLSPLPISSSGGVHRCLSSSDDGGGGVRRSQRQLKAGSRQQREVATPNIKGERRAGEKNELSGGSRWGARLGSRGRCIGNGATDRACRAAMDGRTMAASGLLSFPYVSLSLVALSPREEYERGEGLAAAPSEV